MTMFSAFLISISIILFIAWFADMDRPRGSPDDRSDIIYYLKYRRLWHKYMKD